MNDLAFWAFAWMVLLFALLIVLLLQGVSMLIDDVRRWRRER